MENLSFLTDLFGKTVLIKTYGGTGTKEANLVTGEYKGILLGFDGNFIRLEYEVVKFMKGDTIRTKEIILVNSDYVISVNETGSKDF
jgi:hypothetical protein